MAQRPTVPAAPGMLALATLPAPESLEWPDSGGAGHAEHTRQAPEASVRAPPSPRAAVPGAELGPHDPGHLGPQHRPASRKARW